MPNTVTRITKNIETVPAIMLIRIALGCRKNRLFVSVVSKLQDRSLTAAFGERLPLESKKVPRKLRTRIMERRM